MLASLKKNVSKSINGLLWPGFKVVPVFMLPKGYLANLGYTHTRFKIQYSL